MAQKVNLPQGETSISKLDLINLIIIFLLVGLALWFGVDFILFYCINFKCSEIAFVIFSIFNLFIFFLKIEFR